MARHCIQRNVTVHDRPRDAPVEHCNLFFQIPNPEQAIYAGAVAIENGAFQLLAVKDVAVHPELDGGFVADRNQDVVAAAVSYQDAVPPELVWHALPCGGNVLKQYAVS